MSLPADEPANVGEGEADLNLLEDCGFARRDRGEGLLIAESLAVTAHSSFLKKHGQPRHKQS